MKLGELNSAIRTLKGPPTTTAWIRSVDGTVYPLRGLEFTKQSILNALKATFPDGGRATETCLSLVDGKLVMDVAPAPDAVSPCIAFRHPDADAAGPPVTAEPDTLTDEADDDLDNLFG